MSEVISLFKQILQFFFPFEGGINGVFSVLSNGLALFVCLWFFFMFLMFLVRGFKRKK